MYLRHEKVRISPIFNSIHWISNPKLIGSELQIPNSAAEISSPLRGDARRAEGLYPLLIIRVLGNQCNP